NPKELQDLFRDQIGSVYREDRFLKDVAALQRHYKNQGYEMTLDEKSGPDRKHPESLQVILIVSRGEEVKVAGNKQIKTSVILREMRSRKGDYLNHHLLALDRQRILKLDAFDEVAFVVQVLSHGKVELTIQVTEKAGLKKVHLGR